MSLHHRDELHEPDESGTASLSRQVDARWPYDERPRQQHRRGRRTAWTLAVASVKCTWRPRARRDRRFHRCHHRQAAPAERREDEDKSMPKSCHVAFEKIYQ